MKSVKVVYPYGKQEPQSGILIENLDDLKELKSLVDISANHTATKFVKSGEPPSRLDHVVCSLKGIERALGAVAVTQADIKDTNPIFCLGSASTMMLKTVSDYILQGKTVFINKMGGCCSVEDYLTIVEVNEYEAVFTLQPTLRSGKVINLENDPELEIPAWNFMENELKDKNFSYITELRLYDGKRLERTFKKFMDGGGDTIYVYTTGQDVDQMYEYSQAGLSAGIRKFIFQFKFGTDPNIDRFLEWLGHRANVQNIPVKK